MPVLGGKLRNSSIAASNPPAEPPMPTIGQFEFLLSGFAFDFALARFNRDIFVPLGLIRPRGMLSISLCALRPCALVMLPVPSASYNR